MDGDIVAPVELLCLPCFTSAILLVTHSSLWRWFMSSFASVPTWVPTWKRWSTDTYSGFHRSWRGGWEEVHCVSGPHSPGYSSPASAHFGKNQIENVRFSKSWNSESDFSSAGEQGGRQSSSRMAAFTLSRLLRLCPRVLKTLPFLPSSEFFFEILPFGPTRSYKPSVFIWPVGGVVNTIFSVLENCREHWSGCLGYSRSHCCFPGAFSLGPASRWIWQPKEIDREDSSDDLGQNEGWN